MTTKQQVKDLLHDESRTIPERMAAVRDLPGVSGPVQQLLDESWEQRDWDTFELAVIAGFEGPDTSMTRVLCTALESGQPAVPTEDVLMLLADVKDPESTETLRRVLEDPPEWDEFYQTSRKSIWALAAIGTPRAREILEAARDNGHEFVREWAGDELSRWQ